MQSLYPDSLQEYPWITGERLVTWLSDHGNMMCFLGNPPREHKIHVCCCTGQMWRRCERLTFDSLHHVQHHPSDTVRQSNTSQAKGKVLLEWGKLSLPANGKPGARVILSRGPERSGRMKTETLGPVFLPCSV